MSDEQTLDTIDADTLATALTPMSVADWGGTSSIGLARSENQDRWLALPTEGVFAVADGMGGPSGGAVAAEAAIESLRQVGDPPDLGAALRAANLAVRKQLAESGMVGGGTTITIAWLIGGSVLLIAHVGDSRAFLIRDQQVLPITTDHVRPMGDSGELRVGLTQFLGMPPDRMVPDLRSIALSPGDRVVLCTDGVHRQVGEGEFGRIAASGSAAESANRLVAEADRRGGRDNSTAVIFDV